MCASTYMNSRGCPRGPYKRGIKTVGQAPRLRTDLRESSRPVFRCGPSAGSSRHRGPPSYRGSQRVSAAAMKRPPPINNAIAIPPRTEKTRCRRSAGFVSAAAVCAAKRPIQKLLMDQPKLVWRLERASRATLDRGRAYSALRAGTCALDLPLWSARHRPQRRSPSQPRRRERVLHARSVETFHIAHDRSRDGSIQYVRRRQQTWDTSRDLGDSALVTASRRNGGASFMHGAGLDPKAVAFQHG